MNMTEHNELRGVLMRNEPMMKHTSWRVGGEAEIFYKPEDIDDLCLFLNQQDNKGDITFVGLGSNLLVRDKGINGIVVCASGVLNNLKALAANQYYVEIGVPAPKLAKHSAKASLTGAEFLCGIPGTIGGALAMNAGAMGDEIWRIVKDVTTIDTYGVTRVRSADEFDIAYRSVKAKPDAGFTLGKTEWFIAATIQLTSGDRTVSEKTIKSHLARRAATQPTQQPNAGSVFRNPEGDFAARLIESAGLKGYCIGGACVSDKHANFIINTGTATANDVEMLIQFIHRTVLSEFDINMVQEVRIIGELNDQ